MSNNKTLIIVESPTKAKTLGRFLDSSYIVTSSLGHIRDLPKSKMGVDIEHNFAPQYVIPREKQKQVTALKKLAAKATRILFATDEDREGEAISWHLKELLNAPDERTARIVFHEITRDALKKALAEPRTIDMHLVDAQTARRILDRLVGYELSPFLWRKVTKGLSAGRVQSVAVRLIVEREREIEKFVSTEYWSIEATLNPAGKDNEIFVAHLIKRGETTLDKFELKNEKDACAIVATLKGAAYRVGSITKKDVRKSPSAPFTTSTLQQDAYRRLRFSPKQTMLFAQQLYEGVELGEGSEGLITYMRTDSFNLAQEFLKDAQKAIRGICGEQYAKGARAYKTKSKLAQEAHEAIRPTSAARTPDSVKQYLNEQQWKLYDLIWRRALASQIPDALFEATTIDVGAKGADAIEYTLRATGQVCRFDGFLSVYKTDTEETNLPAVSEGEELVCSELKPEQHFTKPPSRYSEASLVKTLEEYGIGRPSTYAPTISTIIERNYVQREEGRLKPTDIAFLVIDLLVEHFPSIVDYEFTARMEDNLDTIAEGKKEWAPVLREFYEPFHETLVIKEKELSKTKISVEETDKICEKCGKSMVIRTGRFGKFLACSGFPDCKNAKPLEEKSEEQPADVPPCEKCGAPMTLKRGRFGPFYGCSRYPECTNIRNMRDKKLDIKCPKCGKGDVVMKRSKRGKTFFGCSRYPDCDFVSWTKPEKTEE